MQAHSFAPVIHPNGDSGSGTIYSLTSTCPHMKRAFALLLSTGLLTTLAACDYNSTPGKDPQVNQDFTEAMPARSTEISRDSISGGDEAYTPIGTGSANDQKTSVDAGLEGAPKNAGSPASDIPTDNAEVRSTTREQ